MPDRLPYKLGQPVVKVSLLGFSPDLDPSTRGILTNSAALVPTEQGYFGNASIFQAFGSQATSSGGLQYGTCTGMFYSPSTYKNTTANQTSGIVLAAFDSGGISLLENNVFTNWTNGVGVLGGIPWPVGGAARFTQFGNDIIAVNQGASPQVWNVQGATNFFTALGGSPPKGSVVQSVSNNFVFITGAAAPYDDWSTAAAGTDNSWTPSLTTLAATGRLEDTNGPITALKPLYQLLSFACYKQTATYLGQFVGPPTIWQFTPISTAIGTFSQESVVDIGGIHVFPSFYDFYAFDGDSLQKIDTPLHDYFYKTCNITACSQPAQPGSPVTSSPSNIIGAFDYLSNTVFWFFPTTGTVLDTWIAWNIKSNKWTKGGLPTGSASFTGAITPFFGPYGKYGDVNGVLQSTAFQVGVMTQAVAPVSTVGFGYEPFPIASQLYGFGGTNVTNYSPDPTAQFTTGDIGDGLHYFLVTRVRPKFERFPLNIGQITLNGFIKTDLGSTAAQVTGPIPMDIYGWFNMRQSGKWHSFQINLGDQVILSELEVEMVPQGIR
jgi:hypothetical protein